MTKFQALSKMNLSTKDVTILTTIGRHHFRGGDDPSIIQLIGFLTPRAKDVAYYILGRGPTEDEDIKLVATIFIKDEPEASLTRTDIMHRPEGMPIKRNPRTICDMITGPCACGAWHTHTAEDVRDLINLVESLQRALYAMLEESAE